MTVKRLFVQMLVGERNVLGSVDKERHDNQAQYGFKDGLMLEYPVECARGMTPKGEMSVRALPFFAMPAKKAEVWTKFSALQVMGEVVSGAGGNTCTEEPELYAEYLRLIDAQRRARLSAETGLVLPK